MLLKIETNLDVRGEEGTVYYVGSIFANGLNKNSEMPLVSDFQNFISEKNCEVKTFSPLHLPSTESRKKILYSRAFEKKNHYF